MPALFCIEIVVNVYEIINNEYLLMLSFLSTFAHK